MLLIRPTAMWKNIKTDKKKKNKQFVYSVNMLTLVKVELLVGRAVTESFDVHQVAVHVRVVQSAERHVCREGVCVCVIITSKSDWTEVTSCHFSPAVFCFLMGGAREGLLCIPVATTTCEVGTAIMAGAAGAGVGVMATVVFLTVFFGDSEEIGTLLSSYSFLFTVLFI